MFSGLMSRNQCSSGCSPALGDQKLPADGNENFPYPEDLSTCPSMAVRLPRIRPPGQRDRLGILIDQRLGVHAACSFLRIQSALIRI